MLERTDDKLSEPMRVANELEFVRCKRVVETEEGTEVEVEDQFEDIKRRQEKQATAVEGRHKLQVSSAGYFGSTGQIIYELALKLFFVLINIFTNNYNSTVVEERNIQCNKSTLNLLPRRQLKEQQSKQQQLVEESQSGLNDAMKEFQNVLINGSLPDIESQKKFQRNENETLRQNFVAGFEEQIEAEELSCKLIEEALENICKRSESAAQEIDMKLEAEVEQVAQDIDKLSTPQKDEPNAEIVDASSSGCGSTEPTSCSSRHSINGTEEGELEADVDVDVDVEHGIEIEHDEDEVHASDSIDSDLDDFCGRQASELNLRRLKMSAHEDVQVCGQNRHSTESARRLFTMLATPRNEARKSVASSSFRSNSSCQLNSYKSPGDTLDRDKTQNELEDLNNNDDHENCLTQDDLRASSCNRMYEDIMQSSDQNGEPLDDYGTIKVIRRIKGCTSSCSSASSASSYSSSVGNTYASLGRTLVCSVSPDGSTRIGVKPSSDCKTSDWTGERLNPNCYSIDGEEIRQCRRAFHSNRRLIEQAQTLALKQMRQQAENDCLSPNRCSGLSRCSSQATVMTDKSRWFDSLGRREALPDCSRCHKKLYPVDRMELDFTRARLNIHRNCFKCQVCSTLLSVEGSFDTEMDSLAEMFSNSLAKVNSKLGGPTGSGAQVESSSEADVKMRDLYSQLEKVLMEARQLSANSRSALISSNINTLRI